MARSYNCATAKSHNETWPEIMVSTVDVFRIHFFVIMTPYRLVIFPTFNFDS